MKIISIFHLKIFIFGGKNFSFLNRHVFVMKQIIGGIIPTNRRETTIVYHFMSRHTKKGHYGFPVSGPSNAHAQSPNGDTDMRFCLKVATACLRTVKARASFSFHCVFSS